MGSCDEDCDDCWDSMSPSESEVSRDEPFEQNGEMRLRPLVAGRRERWSFRARAATEEAMEGSSCTDEVKNGGEKVLASELKP